MTKTFVIAWIVLFVLWMAGSFLVHGVWLGADYAKLQHMFRSPEDSQQYFPIMLMAHVLLLLLGVVTAFLYRNAPR